ncbi:MAG: GGDEF domain-containing protein [Deltaproteobacteria bacterium]|nr:GGDEF domain-containing protein [Deltaproteobacteria bacterium]
MVNVDVELDVVVSELERTLEAMEKNYRKAVTNLGLLRARAETDDLTRLLRRGSFLNKVEKLLDESKAETREVSILMIDLDHFKTINDRFGHQTGDNVLERISAMIREYLRPGDLAGRYGGEEIIVALQASAEEAIMIAERIREAVSACRMQSAEAATRELSVTMSVGIASTSRTGFRIKALIGEADRALYRAKKEGRDRVLAA